MSGDAAPLILAVDEDMSRCMMLADMLESEGFRVTTLNSSGPVVATICAEPPVCIILPLDLHLASGAGLVETLRRNSLSGHLPIVVTLEHGQFEQADWHETPADDFLVRPFTASELASRVRLCQARAQRDINANPLTGLPGNISIMREIQHRLEAKDTFAVAYLDVDHFKPFNDKYGFSRGDEVLRMTARLLVNSVQSLPCPNVYVGHVGGDDFIYITPPEFVEKVTADIIRNFDMVVPAFYDDEDRTRGEIRSTDRAGNPQTFPIMGISIAIVDSRASEIKHVGHVSARVAELKHLAKSRVGSNYVIDRRK